MNPGDLVVGDDDGILVLPREAATEILDRADKKHASEERQLETTLKGAYDGAWIDEALHKLGCEFVS
ncbi:MAG: hypothetical protein GYB50_27075 [Rhodobacteraceae bacterium]|nr:hypothetical protein [Paracoccaceae bacterium]